MSRLGKKPIKIPEEVKLEISGSLLKFSGPKGRAELELPKNIEVKIENDKLQLISLRKRKMQRILYGVTRSKVANIIKGLNKGFKKKLELFGVGYTANIEGENMKLTLGYSHPVLIKKPEGVEVEIKKNEIEIYGTDKEKVGQFAAQIRDLKRAEPYKGKGFKYSDEVIRRKVGKAALKTEGEAK